MIIKKNKTNHVKIFCLPYAGGSSAIYYSLRRYLNSSIELVPIELPGRGIRFGESLIETIDGMTDDVFASVSRNIGLDDYALFGHSMGGIIAFEIKNGSI